MKHFTKIEKCADLVLLGGVLASILPLFYVFYYWGYTKQRSFDSPTQAFLYVGLPLIATAILVALRRLKGEAKTASALIGISLVGSVYGVELFLQLSKPYLFSAIKPFWEFSGSEEAKQKAKELGRRHGIDFDTREGHEVVADLRKRGVDAVPSISAADQLLRWQPGQRVESVIRIDGKELIPLGGISNKVTVLCNENGYWVTYKSDERGFHNSPGQWASGPIDIAAAGDSYTQGYCVPPERNYVHLVRQRYPAMLNLGIHGNGPLLMLAGISEYLPLHKPKTVLWFYYEQNDLIDLEFEKKSAFLMRYLEEGFTQKLAGRQSDIDGLLLADLKRQKAVAENMRGDTEQKGRNFTQSFMEFARLYALRTRLGLADGGTSKPEVDLDLFATILSLAKTRVGAWGGKLYFVYLPFWGRYTNILDAASEQRASVLSSVKALAIPIVDLHPVFSAQIDPLSLFPFGQYGHYTERGHQLVADTVLEAIAKEK